MATQQATCDAITNHDKRFRSIFGSAISSGELGVVVEPDCPGRVGTTLQRCLIHSFASASVGRDPG
jgi:hypothetical protein